MIFFKFSTHALEQKVVVKYNNWQNFLNRFQNGGHLKYLFKENTCLEGLIVSFKTDHFNKSWEKCTI